MSPTCTVPTLAVVIIGRNEGSRLERCIRSVKAIRNWAGRIEIFYVDSGSTDSSCARAHDLGCTVINVTSDRPSAARGRNAGWRRAGAPLVLFLDGDTILDPDFLATAAAALAEPKVAAVCGRRREIHPDGSLYNRVLDLDWISSPGSVEFCGGDALIRREALLAADGYDDTLIAGEEPDMCRRMRGLGWQILHLDCPMTGHDLAMYRWRQYWRRAVRTGYAYAEVSERYASTAMPLWLSESRSNLKRGGFWAFVSLTAILAAAFGRSWLPLAAALLLLIGMSVRTARRFSWKSSEKVTLFLYGLHSHVQQLPIMVGQFSYWRAKRRGRGRRLIEYKESGA
jgi:cellulose synthase/poly-beta-1,6-N-acetylglucosamine synthase-like glycosyltransferase